jgi:glucosyl-dolichyl phosphate glucuronosyltransferase
VNSSTDSHLSALTVPDSNADSAGVPRSSVSAIMCTRNRCGVLAAALEGLAASQLPSSVAWEVLVVDNNSTDQTREVVEAFCLRYPNIFRYIFEPKSGKSYALNTGVRRARGDILAFVDDDVTVGPRWLHSLTASLHDGRWAGAGGRILPAQAFAAPSWFSVQDLGGVLFGRFDFGDEAGELRTAPFGANMAFRRAMFDKHGEFRTDLGPGQDPETPRPNEDTEFGRRLMGAGERLRYEPEAIVYHPVLFERINQRFFLSWWFDYGRAQARECDKRSNICGIKYDYFSILNHSFHLLPVQTLRWMFSFNPRQRFRNRLWMHRTAGWIAETYRRVSTARK